MRYLDGDDQGWGRECFRERNVPFQQARHLSYDLIGLYSIEQLGICPKMDGMEMTHIPCPQRRVPIHRIYVQLQYQCHCIYLLCAEGRYILGYRLSALALGVTEVLLT